MIEIEAWQRYEDDAAPVVCPHCAKRIPIEKVLSDLRPPDGFVRYYRVRDPSSGKKAWIPENQINPRAVVFCNTEIEP